MEEQAQANTQETPKEHKKKCGFCPLSSKCPLSGKPYVCAAVVIVGAYFIFR